MKCIFSICLKKLLVLTKYMLKIGFQMISCCEASLQPSLLCIYHDKLSPFCLVFVLLCSLALITLYEYMFSTMT